VPARSAYTFGVHEFTPSLIWIRVAQSLFFCVVFYRSLFFLMFFSFGHYFVCPSSIYDYSIIFTQCCWLYKAIVRIAKIGSHWSMYNFNYEYMTFLYVVHVYMFCNVVLYCIALLARVLFAIKIITPLVFSNFS
jgi:hypothetical protein